MTQQEFSRQYRKTLSAAESEISEMLQRVKDETNKRVELLRKNKETGIANIREELEKEINEIEATIKELQSRVANFRNGVYKKYFAKVLVTNGSLQKSDAYKNIQSVIQSALSTLSSHESEWRVWKALTNAIKKHITQACQQIVNNMSKLNSYLENRKKAIADAINSREIELTEKLQAEEEKEWESSWQRLEKEIEHKINVALSEIIGV